MPETLTVENGTMIKGVTDDAATIITDDVVSKVREVLPGVVAVLEGGGRKSVATIKITLTEKRKKGVVEGIQYDVDCSAVAPKTGIQRTAHFEQGLLSFGA